MADAGGDGDGGVIALSVTAVALSSAALLLNVAVSFHQRLGMHTQLLVAAVRMVVQLSLLGFILVPIFRHNKWWSVGLYMTFMASVASLESTQRPRHSYQGMLGHAALAMAVSCFTMLAFTVLLVLRLEPAWDAQYTVPIMGMLLGNATSGVSVGFSTLLEEFATRKDTIELQLAFGASRSEACAGAVQRAVRTALMPLVNQMAVIGLVSIPGMMTGQILAGSNPAEAARYQMVLMFVIGGSTALAATTSVYLAVIHLVDEEHALRLDRLHTKARGGEAWAAWLQGIRKALSKTRDLCAACLCCVAPSTALTSTHKAARRRQSEAQGARNWRAQRGAQATQTGREAEQAPLLQAPLLQEAA
ncbi:hypothetical protein V8C86DRAFT_3142181 [Haematococcus lacustris]